MPTIQFHRTDARVLTNSEVKNCKGKRKDKGDGQPGARSSPQYGVKGRVYCTQPFSVFVKGYFRDLNP